MHSSSFFKKVAVMLCAAALFACNDKMDDLNLDQENQAIEQEISAITEKGTFVSSEQAKEVAEAFFSSLNGGSTSKSSLKSFANVSIETVKDQGNPLMYVINYPEGGWAIVSATRNYFPVLAHSDEGSFVIQSPEEMGPISGWIDGVKEAIRTSESFDDSTKFLMRYHWNKYEMAEPMMPTSSMLKRGNDPDDAFWTRLGELRAIWSSVGYTFYPLSNASQFFGSLADWYSLCNTAASVGSPLEYTIVGIKSYKYTSRTAGPFLTTKWSQGSPYNTVCCGGSNAAGCAAVAMSQIMKYHKRPASLTYNGHTINWNNLPDQPDANNQIGSVGHLIAATGVAAKTSYWPTGSWALPGDVVDALRNYYSYTVNRTSHNHQTLMTEVITNKRPVLMIGFPSTVNPNGHYWVCSGARDSQTDTEYFVEYLTNNYGYYQYTTLGITSPLYPSQISHSEAQYYINWGWGGSYDSWFHSGTFTSPGNGSNFNTYRENFYIQ